jgi:hypothetical protein
MARRFKREAKWPGMFEKRPGAGKMTSSNTGGTLRRMVEVFALLFALGAFFDPQSPANPDKYRGGG